MEFKKIFGWFLLIIGIFLIFWVLYSSYNIFTTKAEVPEIFKLEEQIKEEELSEKKSSLSQEEIMKEMMKEQIKEVFPTSFLSILFNLIAWLIFASILIFAGAQISGLGIRLIKE